MADVYHHKGIRFWLSYPEDVPNRSRFLAGLDRKLGHGDFPPHHFLWFSQNVLARLLKEMTFEPIYIMKCGNLPFSELSDKLLVLLIRKFVVVDDRSVWKKVFKALIFPATVFLWAGLKLSPSNIYFQAKLRAS